MGTHHWLQVCAVKVRQHFVIMEYHFQIVCFENCNLRIAPLDLHGQLFVNHCMSHAAMCGTNNTNT